MDIEEWLYNTLEVPQKSRTPDTIPANVTSRQVWQDAVEELATYLRIRFDQPAFGLPESEISVHYHLPLHRFAKIVRHQLGYPQ